MDAVGATPTGSSANCRVVNYYAARVEGNDFIIKPHQQRLEFDTEYYVVIDRDAIVQEDFRVSMVVHGVSRQRLLLHLPGENIM